MVLILELVFPPTLVLVNLLDPPTLYKAWSEYFWY
jgi:hypothetical protein